MSTLQWDRGGPMTTVFLCPVDDILGGVTTGPKRHEATRNAERLACHDPTRSPAGQPFFAFAHARDDAGGILLSTKGKEAQCGPPGQTPYAPFTFPLFGLAERDDTSIVARQALNECANDLAFPLSSAATLAGAFPTGLAAPECVSTPRFFGALDDAKQAFDHSYYKHLIQQWLGMVAFMARQGSQGSEIVAALEGEPMPANGLPFAASTPLEKDPAKLLAILDDALDLVLDARIAPEVIDAANALDYRKVLGATGDYGKGDQGVNLAVALTETATSYLLAQDQHLLMVGERTAGKCALAAAVVDREAAVARAGRSLRYATAVAGLADAVAAATKKPLADAVRLSRAQRELAAVRQRVVDRSVGVTTCAPDVIAGLDSDNAPIVFDDPLTPTPRFFASSDYFRKLALNEANIAKANLDAARDAWIRARDSKIQALVQNESMKDRVHELKRHYGGTIADYCGMPDNGEDVLALFDPKTGGLTPESCFRATSATCKSNTDASCYRGTMGEAALAVVAAAADIDLSRRAWVDAQAKYDKKFTQCREDKKSRDVGDVLRTQHGLHILELQSAKASADTIAEIAQAARECSNFFQQISSVGGNCTAATTEHGAKIASIGFQLAIDQSNAAYQREVDLRVEKMANDNCFLEAEMLHIDIPTAQAQIERQRINLASTLVKLASAQASVRRLVLEGRTAVAREEAKSIPSVEHHYWLDEKVEIYRSQFGWAKHLVYLALRATERDLQLSLSLRDAVVGAKNPRVLLEALMMLDQAAVSRKINNQAPHGSSFVVSLRDDILKYPADPVVPDMDVTHKQATARLRALLLAPSAVMRDVDGAPLGRGISFSLPPEVTGGDRCAERLWRVHVAATGEPYADGTPLHISVYKKNVFGSRWCAGRSDGTKLQMGLARPIGYFFGGHKINGQAVTWPIELPRSYTQGYADVIANPASKVDFLNDRDEGTQAELAGMGLFGEYALLIPENVAPHFNIAKTDDIWIRFDYEDIGNGNLGGR